MKVFLKLQGDKNHVVPRSYLGDVTEGKSQQHWRRHLSGSAPTSCFIRYLTNAHDLCKLPKLTSAPLYAVHFNSYVYIHFYALFYSISISPC